MKDSQPISRLELDELKYIKANNERFSTPGAWKTDAE